MLRILLGLFFVVAATPCLSKQMNNDKLEPINRGIYKFNRTFDAMYIKPIAQTYSKTFPSPVKTSINNFVNNIGEIPTTANSILQGNAKAAGNGITRFVINSSLGILGLFDVATSIGIKAQKEDLGQTLGKWGYTESTYLVLPILGPSTFRDTLGLVGDDFMSIPHYLKPKWRNRYSVMHAVNKRSNLISTEDVLDVAGVDEYVFVKNAYLQNRAYKITGKDESPTNDDLVLEGPPD